MGSLFVAVVVVPRCRLKIPMAEMPQYLTKTLPHITAACTKLNGMGGRTLTAYQQRMIEGRRLMVHMPSFSWHHSRGPPLQSSEGQLASRAVAPIHIPLIVFLQRKCTVCLAHHIKLHKFTKSPSSRRVSRVYSLFSSCFCRYSALLNYCSLQLGRFGRGWHW